MELEAGYDLSERWRLEAAADYVRAEGGDDQPARIPPPSATGRLLYDGGRLQARAEARFVAEQDEVARFERPTDGYGLLNAFVSWRLTPGPREGVVVYLDGRNLTDQEAREHASFLKDIAPLPGRAFRAGLVWRY